jgi:hypothetical protein
VDGTDVSPLGIASEGLREKGAEYTLKLVSAREEDVDADAGIASQTARDKCEVECGGNCCLAGLGVTNCEHFLVLQPEVRLS